MVDEPVKGEPWTEKDGGAVFTIRSVDSWPSGKTVFAINVPARRMYTGPLDSFMERFERKQQK